MVDSHEDLAWNILTFGRDYTRSAEKTRLLEKDTDTPRHNNDTLLGWEEYQTANVGIIFSTLFAAPIRTREGDWDTQTYTTRQDAHRMYRTQLDTYMRLTDTYPDKFRLLRSGDDINCLLADRELVPTGKERVIGLLPLMEGADCIRNPRELPEWVDLGVRLIGLAWQATAYSGGTREPGPLTEDGIRLLQEMDSAGCVLDISHMDEKAVWQALDRFQGRVMASHVNPNHFLRARNSNRFVNDDVIRTVVERNGVMGLVPYNLFLDPEWVKNGAETRTPIQRFVEQIDYVCQLAGSAEHAAIGTDFDGGFGLQNAPLEINSIADIPIIAPMLLEKGYTNRDIENIFGENWIRFLLEALP